MKEKSTNDSTGSISSIDETYPEHRLTRATVWSDASLDEEEEKAIVKATDLEIEKETDEEMKAALAINPKHSKFDIYLRDMLHFILCTNNFVDKPLREVWISKGSPFKERMGYAALVEQIISRTSLKAIFMSKKIRHTKDACDIIEFVFRRRKAEYYDDCYLLMLELVVIAFEILLYCIMQEMLVLPMKDVVKVCTKLYRKMLKSDFQRKLCWQYLDTYVTREYQRYFPSTKICFKTLGYPYDIFAIPETCKEIWKRKVKCITKTFYDYVPLKYFYSVAKEYRNEFDKLDLTPDGNFVRRVIMRKAARRKVHRQERLKAETLIDAANRIEARILGDTGTWLKAKVLGDTGTRLEAKALGDTGTRLEAKTLVDTGTLHVTRPLPPSGSGIESYGGAKPKDFGGAKPKVIHPFDSEIKKKTKRPKKHGRSKVEERLGGRTVIGGEEHDSRGSLGILDDAEYETVGTSNIKSSEAVGDAKSFKDEKHGDFDYVESIGDEELGACGGVGISYPRHEMAEGVSERPKQSILKKSKTRSSSKVRWDETTFPDKPETKKKLKPRKKKAVAVYVPEEVMSDLECLRIYEDSDNGRSPRPPDKKIDQSIRVPDPHQQKIVDADPPLPTSVESDSLIAAHSELSTIPKSDDQSEEISGITEECAAKLE